MSEPGGDSRNVQRGREAPATAAAAASPNADGSGAPVAPAAMPRSRSAKAATGTRQGRSTRPARSGPGRPLLRYLTLIARLAGPPAALAVLATIALAVALATLQEVRSGAVNAWLLTIGGLLVWTCWRALAAALPTAAATEFDSVRGRPLEPPSELREVKAIVGVILDAEWSWRGVEFRLRPLLRRIAAARLIERYQVDLETEPAAAHRILGDELWALVGPGAYGPDEAARAATPAAAETPARPATHRIRTHQARGISRATIRRAVDLLEAL